jgi:hypothetical protein
MGTATDRTKKYVTTFFTKNFPQFSFDLLVVAEISVYMTVNCKIKRNIMKSSKCMNEN